MPELASHTTRAQPADNYKRSRDVAVWLADEQASDSIVQENGSGALDMRGMRNLVKSLPQYRCDLPILLGACFVTCLLRAN